MFNLSKLSISTSLRPLLRIASLSTARPTVIVQNSVENVTESTPATEEIKRESLTKHTIQKVKEIKTGGLVAAAFASLQEENLTSVTSKTRPNYTDKKIAKATNVDELLSIHEDNMISRQNALKVVSMLAQWSAAGKVNSSEFESDPRFIKLCRILSRGNNGKNKINSRPVRGDDLSMVLGVTGDDEAAKLIASITLPQMIKVMSTLAQKKRRSTPLLRSLAYNISRSTIKLDIKQCADVLYCMTVLNFPENLLLERISNDVVEGLETNNDRSAVIGSLLTSLGLLRYRDPGVLDALSEWIVKYNNICRPQDIAALFQTLAVCNYHPSNSENIYKILIPQLNMKDYPKPSSWLDIVWSLVVLNKATNEHISSVLNPDFITKLQGDTNSISHSTKAKLLNVNGAAMFLIPDYKGPRVDDTSSVRVMTITRPKEKQIMVNSMVDSLGSLFTSSSYLKVNSNTGMGFLIDGECVVDTKCNPVPVTKPLTAKDHHRIAILAYDYHDTCRGDGTPHGANALAARLLEAQGYKLMIVPFTDFNPWDKLVQRVQYLEKQLKAVARTISL